MAAAIVTALSNFCAANDHADLTITAPNGQVYNLGRLALDDGQLTDKEWIKFLTYAARVLAHHKNVPLTDFLSRCVVGDEATNVKIYDLISPGGAIIATNIGTSFANVLPGVNGQRVPVDFTGCSQFRIFANVQVITTSPNNGLRIVRHADNSVLATGALTDPGENEFDNGWTALPAAFITADPAVGFMPVRLQGKAPNATDDPVFRRCQLLVR